MLEARKHLVQYLHGFPGVKEYRSRLVQVESPTAISEIVADIKKDHSAMLDDPLSVSGDNPMITG